MSFLAEILSSGVLVASAGAMMAIVVAGISSAKGLGISGNAAAGVTAEDEKNFSSALILEALPQTQVVYGFIIAVLIVVGIMGGEMTLEKGLVSLVAGTIVGFAGLSAIPQGKVAAAAIGAVAKNEKVRGKVLVFIVMPEIAALFGFVIAILLLVSANVF
ncbi:MAG: V-type ATP synthase subunit K [Candidatus Altiarchaeota archaeon]